MKRANIGAFVLFFIGLIGRIIVDIILVLGGAIMFGSAGLIEEYAAENNIDESALRAVYMVLLIWSIISVIISVTFIAVVARNKNKPMGKAYPIISLIWSSLGILYNILNSFANYFIPFIIWLFIFAASIIQLAHKEKNAAFSPAYSGIQPPQFPQNQNGFYVPQQQNPYQTPYGADPYRQQSPYINPYAPQQDPFSPFAQQQKPYGPNPYADAYSPQRNNDAGGCETQNGGAEPNPFEPPK